MSTFWIKVIAITTMIIDHIGLFFFPQSIILRAIGRISYPLFAWLVANGVRNTRSVYWYGARVLLLAAISQVPFLLLYRLFNPAFDQRNAIFTLFLGLVAAASIQRLRSPLWYVPIIALLSYVGSLVRIEYGAGGVLLVVAAYVAARNVWLLAALIAAISGVFYVYPQVEFALAVNNWDAANFVALLHPVSLLGVIAVAMYNRSRGPRVGYWWYLVYPLHFFLIYLMLTRA